MGLIATKNQVQKIEVIPNPISLNPAAGDAQIQPAEGFAAQDHVREYSTFAVESVDKSSQSFLDVSLYLSPLDLALSRLEMLLKTLEYIKTKLRDNSNLEVRVFIKPGENFYPMYQNGDKKSRIALDMLNSSFDNSITEPDLVSLVCLANGLQHVTNHKVGLMDLPVNFPQNLVRDSHKVIAESVSREVNLEKDLQELVRLKLESIAKKDLEFSVILALRYGLKVALKILTLLK